MDLLGVGAPEILLVFVVALIVLGPERLPEYAGKVARVIREIRATTQGFTDQITRELQLEEWERKAREMEAEARRATQWTPTLPPPSGSEPSILPPATRSDGAFAVPRSPAGEPLPAPTLVEPSTVPTDPQPIPASAERANGPAERANGLVEPTTVVPESTNLAGPRDHVKVDLGKPSETPQ